MTKMVEISAEYVIPAIKTVMEKTDGELIFTWEKRTDSPSADSHTYSYLLSDIERKCKTKQEVPFTVIAFNDDEERDFLKNLDAILGISEQLNIHGHRFQLEKIWAEMTVEGKETFWEEFPNTSFFIFEYEKEES